MACQVEMAVIQQPTGGFNFQLDSASPNPAFNSSPPFALNGAPLANPPQPITGASEYIRNSKATTDTANMTSYLAEDNYTLVSTPTENIIGTDPQTTLRFDPMSYTLEFIAIHRGLWKADQPQVSMFFKSAGGDMFHICIPVIYTNDSKGENKFLKAWLYKDIAVSGVTYNELLRFPGEKDVRFAVLSGGCLTYNGGRNKNTYTFCLFANSIQLNKNNIQDWLAADPNFTGTLDNQGRNTNRRHMTFDSIFNFMNRGMVRKYVYNMPDPYEASEEAHFNTKFQNAITPAYYKVRAAMLVPKVKESFTNPEIKGLQNVKCYPIDLASQVDSNGNIFVDPDTNKPLDVNDMKLNDKWATYQFGDSSNGQQISGASVQKKQVNNIETLIGFILTFVFFMGIGIVLIIFILRGTRTHGLGTSFVAEVAGAGAEAVAGAAGAVAAAAGAVAATTVSAASI